MRSPADEKQPCTRGSLATGLSEGLSTAHADDVDVVAARASNTGVPTAAPDTAHRSAAPEAMMKDFILSDGWNFRIVSVAIQRCLLLRFVYGN